MIDHRDPEFRRLHRLGWGSAPAEPAPLPDVAADTGEWEPLADESAPAETFTPDLTPPPVVCREFCGGCDEELTTPAPCPACGPADPAPAHARPLYAVGGALLGAVALLGAARLLAEVASGH